MYICQFCDYRSQRLAPYLQHRQFHLHLTQQFHCGFNGCKKMFRLQGSLRSHLLRTHAVVLKGPKNDSSSTIGSINTKLICSLPLCKKEFSSYPAIIKHLKSHIRANEKIKCPYGHCQKEYHILDSFTGHLCKNHKKSSDSISCPAVSTRATGNNTVMSNESVVDEQLNWNEEFSEPSCSKNNDNDSQVSNTSEDLFLMNLAQLYLKLECRLLLPISSVQNVVSGTLSVHEQGQEVVKSNLKTCLIEENVLSDKVDQIINQVFRNDPFLLSSNKLNTDYKRKQFYKDHCAFVNPAEVMLSTDHEEKAFFHYVPIQESLKQLFTDKSLKNDLRINCEIRDGVVQTDFTDGSVYKDSVFFQNNPNSLKLILYQDAFEVVNPIGSAVHKHKLVGIYLSIGNFPEHVRSHVNSIKLVALCKERHFDHEKVYGKIVDDLKTIETEGIQMPSGEMIKGALVFIAGDNLGSHSLGGFVENFSMSTYFCRYCLITRNEFHSDNGQLKEYERRTPGNYNHALSEKGEKNNFQGVKFDSKFNSLSNYHVCDQGLPPCLGHDLLEGIVAYDLKTYIDYFTKEKWFALSTLNKRIESFTYSLQDRRDKPCMISENKKRIVGGAWQIFVFLKLFPLLVEDKIIDIMDSAWLAVLLLLEIVEIVCAPAIHNSCLTYLKSIIGEYILLRKQLGPNLRPKHHYLTHYPELIVKFGPLMKVWTLRFESKHTYFKRALRYSRNYINITKSLSEKHELLQSFLRLGADIRPEIDMKGNSSFHSQLYNNSIQAAVGIVSLPDNIQECSELTVKGIVYRKEDCLVIHQKGYQYGIQIGKVSILLSDEQSVFIVFEVLQTAFNPHLRVYEIGNSVRHECLSLDALPSTEKLHIYNVGIRRCVKPGYGLVGRPL